MIHGGGEFAVRDGQRKMANHEKISNQSVVFVVSQKIFQHGEGGIATRGNFRARIVRLRLWRGSRFRGARGGEPRWSGDREGRAGRSGERSGAPRWWFALGDGALIRRRTVSFGIH